MTLLLLLLACGPEPTWTDDDALTPSLTRLDDNHDGVVDAKEYGGGEGRTFAQADTDQDGALDLSELRAIVDTQDPSLLLGADAIHRRDPNLGPKKELRPAAEELARETLQTLREEVLDADPDADVPLPAEIDRAAVGGLEGEAAQAVLARFRTAYAKAGMTLPKGLVLRP